MRANKRRLSRMPDNTSSYAARAPLRPRATRFVARLSQTFPAQHANQPMHAHTPTNTKRPIPSLRSLSRVLSHSLSPSSARRNLSAIAPSASTPAPVAVGAANDVPGDLSLPTAADDATNLGTRKSSKNRVAASLDGTPSIVSPPPPPPAEPLSPEGVGSRMRKMPSMPRTLATLDMKATRGVSRGDIACTDGCKGGGVRWGWLEEQTDR